MFSITYRNPTPPVVKVGLIGGILQPGTGRKTAKFTRRPNQAVLQPNQRHREAFRHRAGI